MCQETKKFHMPHFTAKFILLWWSATKPIISPKQTWIKWHSSVRKESACNAGDPSSIPGSGRSSGGRIGYPLQSSWASLVAQLVKNPPAMQETPVWSLGWDDPLEKGKATQLQYSGLANFTGCIVHGVTKSRTQLSDFHFLLSLSFSILHISYTHFPIHFT